MLVLLVGVLGMILILLAFLMNQTHRWSEDFLMYDFSNFLGSLLLVTYACLIGSWPFLILNLVWMLYSLKDTVLDMKGKGKPSKNLPGHKKKRLK